MVVKNCAPQPALYKKNQDPIADPVAQWLRDLELCFEFSCTIGSAICTFLQAMLISLLHMYLACNGLNTCSCQISPSHWQPQPSSVEFLLGIIWRLHFSVFFFFLILLHSSLTFFISYILDT